MWRQHSGYCLLVGISQLAAVEIVDLPQIVVMGIASLNAILLGPRHPRVGGRSGFFRMWRAA